MKSPIKISPFARRSSGGSDVLTELFNTYLGHNQWAAENSTVVGTTTTWQDYAGNHNLANPAAGNQPTTTNPDSDFNNKKSATFSTDDYLIKNTPNYGAGQTSGSMWIVFKTPSSFSIGALFGICDASNNLAKFNIFITSGGVVLLTNHNGIIQNNIQMNDVLTVNTTYILEVENNGTSNSFYLNNSAKALTTTLGTNTGWLDYASATGVISNLSIGARINTVSQFYNGKIAYVGNYPLLDSTGRSDMFNKLNTYYNVY